MTPSGTRGTYSEVLLPEASWWWSPSWLRLRFTSAVTPAAAATPASTFPALFFLDGFFAVGFGSDFFAFWYFATPLAVFQVAQPSIAFRFVMIFIGLLSSGLCRRAPLPRDVDGTPECDESRFLDGLGKRRVGRHPVRDRLDGRFRVQRYDSRFDQVGHVRPHHDQPEQLAVARLVDGLDPADRLVLHDRARVRDPREPPDGDVVTVLLASLALGQTDARDLRVGVDRTRHAAIVDDGVVAERVFGRDLALAEGRVRELPVAGAVAHGVDVRNGRPAVLVGGDALAPVVLDADLLEAQPLDRRAAADRDEHQIRLDGLALAEVHGERAARLLDFRALLLEVERDPAPPELLGELLGRVGVLLRDQARKHLDDRHLRAEALEDRCELAADDPAAEHDEPARDLRLGEQTGGVDAELRVEPLDRRPQRKRPRRDDRRFEGHVLAALHGDRVRVLEPPRTLRPFDAVRFEQGGDARRHLVHDRVLPLVRRLEVELRRIDADAELREALLGGLQEERGLHPRLRVDAADAQARPAQLRLLLDAHDVGAELGGPDRGGIAAGSSSQYRDVTFHDSILSTEKIVKTPRVKLTPPRLPASHVRRPALERLLDEAERRRLTSIVAGPGFGKSTLAASVAAEHGWH